MFIGYIYIWTNKINGKSYIGQTLNKSGYKERWSQHVRSANKKEDLSWNGKENRFYKAIRDVGQDSFDMDILECIKMDTKEELKSKLDELEIEYISKYDSYKNGYNSTIGGNFSKFNSSEDSLGFSIVEGRAYRTIQNAMSLKTKSNGLMYELCFDYENYGIDTAQVYRFLYNNIRIDSLYTKTKECGFSDYLMSDRVGRVEDVLSFDIDGIEYIENHIENWCPNNIIEDYNVYIDIYGYDEDMIENILGVQSFECGSDIHCMVIDVDNILKNSYDKLSDKQNKILSLMNNGIGTSDIANIIGTSESDISGSRKRLCKSMMKQYELDYKDSLRNIYIKGEYKKCNKCGKVKLLQYFDSNGRNGHKGKCKDCRKK